MWGLGCGGGARRGKQPGVGNTWSALVGALVRAFVGASVAALMIALMGALMKAFLGALVRGAVPSGPKSFSRHNLVQSAGFVFLVGRVQSRS